MTNEVKVPAMGESVSSGILATWKVKDGETVTKGQPLYDLETDKITSEAYAEEAGVITLKANAGDTVSVGQTVATIEVGAVGEAPAKEESPNAADPEKPASAPAPQPAAEAPKAEDAKFAPSVEKVFEVSGIKPGDVTPTGPKGNITKADAMSAAGMLSDSSSAKRVRMTPLRKKIAERLVGAQHQAAMLTTFNEVDMSAVMGLRSQHKESFIARHGVKLGFMSFFVKAVVEALKSIPQITAQIEGDELVYPGVMDVGVAVSTPRGLMVPVLRGCDKMSFADVERELGDIAAKARDGKITLDALQGGVFTITNGGIFGSMLSTPILNAPQSAILGMHAIKERAVVENGQVVVRPMMYLALSYDHRVVDGKEAVTTLVTIKNALENPTEVMGFEG